MAPPSPTAALLARLAREEHGRLVAALARTSSGDLIRAEDALQQAVLAALQQWPVQGTPDRPVHWLLAVGRNKLRDGARRRATHAHKTPTLQGWLDRPGGHGEADLVEMLDDSAIPDERLRLLCTCCHPALALEAQVALTLKTVAGLTVPELSRLFFVPAPTMAQRIVRAKRKIRDAGVPYAVPRPDQLPARLAGILRVLYLVFTEGYAATEGPALIRAELCREAVRLGRTLARLVPDESEVHGLLSLVLLQDARRPARVDASGMPVLLEDQDRRLWDRSRILAGMGALKVALSCGPPGPYTLQAAIASVHARAAQARDTDWHEVAQLYDLLARASPSPVVELNRAVAWAMVEGPGPGLARLAQLESEPLLARSHLLPAAQGELLRRLGRFSAARAALEQARALVGNGAEKAFLDKRIRELSAAGQAEAPEAE